jgi:hypothetical protein
VVEDAKHVQCHKGSIYEAVPTAAFKRQRSAAAEICWFNADWIDEFSNGPLSNALETRLCCEGWLPGLMQTRWHRPQPLPRKSLTVFDLLTRPGPDLSPEERAEVKKVARYLLERVRSVLVLNWRQKAQARAQVKLIIEDTLDEGSRIPTHLTCTRTNAQSYSSMCSRRSAMFKSLNAILKPSQPRSGKAFDTNRCRSALKHLRCACAGGLLNSIWLAGF